MYTRPPFLAHRAAVFIIIIMIMIIIIMVIIIVVVYITIILIIIMMKIIIIMIIAFSLESSAPISSLQHRPSQVQSPAPRWADIHPGV